jgi:membrane protein implicated in regulation of membrane protease activity
VAHSASTSRAASSRSAGNGEASIGTLVQSAMADMSTLIRNEIELAKSEVTASVKRGGISIAMFAVAGVMLAFAGLFFFVLVAEALALVLPRWAAYGIVTLFLIIVAGIAALIGKRMISRLEKPERTIESLRELPEVMRREEPGQRHRDVPTVNNGRVELRGDSYSL